MVNWTDRKYVNPRKRVFKNMETDEVLNLEIQEDLANIEQESETPLNAEMLNLAQKELQQDIITEVDEKINNLETLPTGGTTGQVLSKKSDQNGDAEWCNIETNEIYIGKEEEAPDSAKLIIEDDSIEEDEVGEFIVSPTEPTGFNRVKKWIRHGTGVEDAEFILENGQYVKFKPEINIIANQEVKTGRKRNGKDEYVYNLVASGVTVPANSYKTITVPQIDAEKVKICKIEGSFYNGANWAGSFPACVGSDLSVSCNYYQNTFVIINNSKNELTIGIDVDIYYTK